MKNKALIILGILFLTFGAYAEKSSKISVRVNNYNAKITSERPRPELSPERDEST